MRPVEVLQAELVGRKVRGNPIEDHAQPALVEVVDEEHEVLRRSIPAGRREVALDLVAPRGVERVLHHRHELDVGEAEAQRVVGELRRELAIGEPPIVVLRHSHPRADVQLVYGPWRLAPVGPRALRHPLAVTPVVAQVPDDRGLPGWRLGECGERVGLVRAVPGDPRMDVVLVQRAVLDARHEPLPDPRLLSWV